MVTSDPCGSPRSAGQVGRGASDAMRPIPRVVALERLLELEHADELVARVAREADEKAEVDEGEDDVAEVGGAAHAPVLEHDAREDAEPLQGEVAARAGELGPADVAALREAVLRELERRQHEQVRLLVEAPLPQPNPIHHAVAKRELRHRLSRHVVTAPPASVRRRAEGPRQDGQGAQQGQVAWTAYRGPGGTGPWKDDGEWHQATP